MVIPAISIALAASFVLAILWAHTIDRADRLRRASLEPVVLLPRAIGIPSAWRKRTGWSP